MFHINGVRKQETNQNIKLYADCISYFDVIYFISYRPLLKVCPDGLAERKSNCETVKRRSKRIWRHCSWCCFSKGGCHGFVHGFLHPWGTMNPKADATVCARGKPAKVDKGSTGLYFIWFYRHKIVCSRIFFLVNVGSSGSSVILSARSVSFAIKNVATLKLVSKLY